MEEQLVKNMKQEVLSDKKYLLKNVNFEYHTNNGDWEKKQIEIYDAGNSVTALLYNEDADTVILTKQFRMASYLNENAAGVLIESCAGKLEKEEEPEEAIVREVKEETGYEITEIKKVFEAYTSPGAYTEKINCFIAGYKPEQQKTEGGGKEEEQEHVEVLELAFDKAYNMIQTGEIRDAKTIMLLQFIKLQQLA